MDMTTLAMAERNRQLKPFNLMEHPAVDIVFDSCYRDVSAQTNAEKMLLDSGHSWEKLQLRSDNPTLRYESNGVLQFRGGGSRDDSTLSGWLVSDFLEIEPYLHVRIEQGTTSSWHRVYYFKFIDENNWIGVRRWQAYTDLEVMIDGVKTVVASAGGYSDDEYISAIAEMRIEIKEVHPTLFPGQSGRAIFVYNNGIPVIKYGLAIDEWNVFNLPTKVGFGGRTTTSLFGFKAGVSIL